MSESYDPYDPYEAAVRERFAAECEAGGGLHRSGFAPEEAVFRRGRAKRTRRRAGYAGAAVFVVAAASAAAPNLLPTPAPRPAAAPAQHSISADHLGATGVETDSGDGPVWVVGSGYVDGRRWTMTLRLMTYISPSSDSAAPVTELCTRLLLGSTGGDTDCGGVTPDDKAVGAGQPVVLSGAQSGDLPYFELGSVRADVTRVQVNLLDGERLTLYPVAAHGKRYVAFAAPVGVGVDQVVAFGKDGAPLGWQAPDTTVDGIPDFGSDWSNPTP